MGRSTKEASYLYPIAVVHWEDSQEHHDGSGAPIHSPAKQIRIGWILKDDKTGVSIATEYSYADMTWRGEHFIPVDMITLIEYVELIPETPPQ